MGTEHSHERMSIRDDVIISLPIEIFVVFILAVATLSAKITNFCTMRKFLGTRYKNDT